MAIGARSQSARTYLEKHLDKFPDSEYYKHAHSDTENSTRVFLEGLHCRVLSLLIFDVSRSYKPGQPGTQKFLGKPGKDMCYSTHGIHQNHANCLC